MKKGKQTFLSGNTWGMVEMAIGAQIAAKAAMTVTPIFASFQADLERSEVFTMFKEILSEYKTKHKDRKKLSIKTNG